MSDSNSTVSNTAKKCDVLVIGGGPGGSTIATLLARQGRDVVLVEKEHHPRFHIGESLLPMNMPLFEQLGVRDEIASIGMLKYGVEFVSPWHDKPSFFEFAQALDKTFSYAYQVRRSEFDRILFRNADRHGAKTLEGCRVTGIEFKADGVHVDAQLENGEKKSWDARFLVDASGRDTFLANHFAIKQKSKEHNSAAIFGHFTGATRLPGKAEGNISVFWFEHGWFWFIPLVDGTTSVGAVCWPYYMKSRKTTPEQFLLDTIALCPALAQRLQNAKLVSPVTATGNYSYNAQRSMGQNYLMVGDAFAFIDPVFSSGVFLAMNSAFLGAEAVSTCLDHPQRALSALKKFDRTVRKGPKTFSWFIYRVTTPAMRNMFMGPRDDFRMRAAVLSVLAGDIFGRTPIRAPLVLFKAIYYIASVINFKNTVTAWHKRRRSIDETSIEAKSMG